MSASDLGDNQRLRTENDQLRLDFDAEIRERRAAVCERDEAIRERDEARREACEYGTLTPSAMYALAKSRGWNCFKETTP